MTTESSTLGALANGAAKRSQPFQVPLDEAPRARRATHDDVPSVVIAPQNAAPDQGSTAVAHADTFAATLLDESAGSPSQNALRLLTGATGTMLLQLATDCAIHGQALHDRLAGPPGLALAAAATLTIGLPGTLILLTALGSEPSFPKAYGALLRSYAQVGLLAGGFAPIVALFALTGGGLDMVSFLSFVAYAIAGTTASYGLVRRVVVSAGTVTFKNLVAGCGLMAFTLAVGTYLWVSLMEAIVR